MFLFLLFLSLSSGSILDNFPIKHFVVLMMENRSFDHLLGHLKQQNPDVDGLTGKETNPYNPYDPKSPLVTVNFEAGAVDPNAGHSVPATTIQVFGGENRTHLNPAPMDGFVRDAEMNGVGWGPKIMSAFNSKSLPVLSTLATEFAVFDQWHASIPGPTEVNRAFFYSGTSNGYATNDLEELALGFPQKTVMQQFEEVGKDWGVFFELAPSTFFMRQLREDVFNFHTLLDFETVCQDGKLPTFSFLEPRYYAVTSEFPANDQHPDHNIEEGEKLIKWVYETVRASPSWNETALMILYDEHGGYYDHVPTPLDNVPSPDGKVSTNPPFDFKRSGVRVPVVVASPWVNKGTVVHKPDGPTPASQYEHSSFIATMKKIFGFQDFLTDRVKWAGTFEHLFLNRTSPRTDCPNTLPSPPTPRFVAPSADALKMNELQLNILASVAGLSGVRANKEFFEKATEADAARFVENQMKAHFEAQGHYLDWDNKLQL